MRNDIAGSKYRLIIEKMDSGEGGYLDALKTLTEPAIRKLMKEC